MTYYVKSTTRKYNILIVKYFRKQKKGKKSEEISKLENERIRKLTDSKRRRRKSEVRGRSTTGGVSYTGEGNEKIGK